MDYSMTKMAYYMNYSITILTCRLSNFIIN